MPELNPITRKRLWYIVIFLLLDGIVALYVSAITPPTDAIAFYAVALGLVSVVIAGAVGSFLVATSPAAVKFIKGIFGNSRVRE